MLEQARTLTEGLFADAVVVHRRQGHFEAT